MKLKLLLIQSNIDDLHLNAQIFSAFGCEIVATGSDGRAALELARKLKPHALIMDPFLPYYNCDEIAEMLELEEAFPLVKIALSNRPCDLLAERFLNNGGDYFLLNPPDHLYCIRRIEKQYSLRKRLMEQDTASSRIRNCIRKYQMRMQMPVSVLGFSYVQDAVEIALEDPSALHHLVGQLYPAVAARHQVPAPCIERCIRTAVERTFKTGDMDFLFPNFGHAIHEDTGKPTNSEFIAILTELVRNDLAKL